MFSHEMAHYIVVKNHQKTNIMSHAVESEKIRCVFDDNLEMCLLMSP